MSVTSATTRYVNTGSDCFGTLASAFAGNTTANFPLASVTAVPRAIRWAAPSNGMSGKKQRHQLGQRTVRSTRQFTLPPATARPVYVVAVPESETFPPSGVEFSGSASFTTNFGRLYSSTRTAIELAKRCCPSACATIDHCPGRPPVAIGKVPWNEPLALVACRALATSRPLASRNVTSIVRLAIAW